MVCFIGLVLAELDCVLNQLDLEDDIACVTFNACRYLPQAELGLLTEITVDVTASASLLASSAVVIV